MSCAKPPIKRPKVDRTPSSKRCTFHRIAVGLVLELPRTRARGIRGIRGIRAAAAQFRMPWHGNPINPQQAVVADSANAEPRNSALRFMCELDLWKSLCLCLEYITVYCFAFGDVLLRVAQFSHVLDAIVNMAIPLWSADVGSCFCLL